MCLIGWLDIKDLKEFRQLGSKTPGHPERGLTPGVECTTGPLGQGVANAVGMAVSEAILRNQFGEDIVSHYTYLLHSDGDIQEPVAQGSIALAGHWGLSRLIGYYDANKAQIAGQVDRSDTTDYKMFYESNNWHVQEVNGQDRNAIRSAIRIAQMEIEKPSIIIGHNVIAPGCASMEGDYNTHGAPLPPEEIFATKEKLGLDPEAYFELSKDVIQNFRQSHGYAKQEVASWKKNLDDKLKADESFKSNWNKSQSGDLSSVEFPTFEAGQELATRKAWGPILDSICDSFDFLVGGSADLDPSNGTTGFVERVKDFNKENHLGRNLAYGVREFPMGAINNGIAQHGGLKVFGATFFVFSDYERPALRLRALQGLPVISEYTHDSIYVGEDGPTHQPIEHLMACRAIPNLMVFRPADANEASIAAELSFKYNDRASIILLTRQKLPVFDRNKYSHFDNFKKGGYVISDSEGSPEITIIATGSEVSLAIDSKKELSEFNIRVVNLGCWELFDEQPGGYQQKVIDDSSFIVSIEAGITQGWQKYTGKNGLNIGINRYGESAPGKVVAKHLGMSVENVAEKIRSNFKK
jgi:transketolase